jgi:hypothetical protein
MDDNEMHLVVRGKVVPPPNMGENYEKVRKLRNDFSREVERIKADKNWSDVGRRNHITKLANDVLPKIESYRAVVGEGRKSLTSMLRPLPEPPTDPASAILAWEIRERLGRLDPLEVKVQMMEAVAAGDTAVFSALLHDPLRMVPTEGAKQKWVTLPRPGMEEQAEQLEESTRILEALIDSSVANTRRDAGIEDEKGL